MKRNFTLLEMMVIAVIILVLATLALGGYRHVLENARKRVCTTNLRALSSAVEMWALENDFLPATLGQLKQEHLERAYAQVINEGGWLTRASYALIKFDTASEVYAQFLTPENLRRFGVSADIFHCPSDHTPPPGGVSYGINTMLPRRWDDIPPDMIIVGDCDQHTFSGSGFARRHRKGFMLEDSFALVCTNEQNVYDTSQTNISDDGKINSGHGYPEYPDDNDYDYPGDNDYDYPDDDDDDSHQTID